MTYLVHPPLFRHSIVATAWARLEADLIRYLRDLHEFGPDDPLLVAKALVAIDRAWVPPTGFVYLIGSAEPDPDGRYRVSDRPVKLGFSADPEARCRQLQTGSAFKLMVLDQEPGSPDVERALHGFMAGEGARIRVRGEWYDSDGVDHTRRGFAALDALSRIACAAGGPCPRCGRAEGSP